MSDSSGDAAAPADSGISASGDTSTSDAAASGSNDGSNDAATAPADSGSPADSSAPAAAPAGKMYLWAYPTRAHNGDAVQLSWGNVPPGALQISNNTNQAGNPWTVTGTGMGGWHIYAQPPDSQLFTLIASDGSTASCTVEVLVPGMAAGPDLGAAGETLLADNPGDAAIGEISQTDLTGAPDPSASQEQIDDWAKGVGQGGLQQAEQAVSGDLQRPSDIPNPDWQGVDQASGAGSGSGFSGVASVTDLFVENVGKNSIDNTNPTAAAGDSLLLNCTIHGDCITIPALTAGMLMVPVSETDPQAARTIQIPFQATKSADYVVTAYDHWGGKAGSETRKISLTVTGPTGTLGFYLADRTTPAVSVDVGTPVFMQFAAQGLNLKSITLEPGARELWRSGDSTVSSVSRWMELTPHDSSDYEITITDGQGLTGKASAHLDTTTQGSVVSPGLVRVWGKISYYKGGPLEWFGVLPDTETEDDRDSEPYDLTEVGAATGPDDVSNSGDASTDATDSGQIAPADDPTQMQAVADLVPGNYPPIGPIELGELGTLEDITIALHIQPGPGNLNPDLSLTYDPAQKKLDVQYAVTVTAINSLCNLDTSAHQFQILGDFNLSSTNFTCGLAYQYTYTPPDYPTDSLQILYQLNAVKITISGGKIAAAGLGTCTLTIGGYLQDSLALPSGSSFQVQTVVDVSATFQPNWPWIAEKVGEDAGEAALGVDLAAELFAVDVLGLLAYGFIDTAHALSEFDNLEAEIAHCVAMYEQGVVDTLSSGLGQGMVHPDDDPVAALSYQAGSDRAVTYIEGVVDRITDSPLAQVAAAAGNPLSNDDVHSRVSKQLTLPRIQKIRGGLDATARTTCRDACFIQFCYKGHPENIASIFASWYGGGSLANNLDYIDWYAINPAVTAAYMAGNALSLYKPDVAAFAKEKADADAREAAYEGSDQPAKDRQSNIDAAERDIDQHQPPDFDRLQSVYNLDAAGLTEVQGYWDQVRLGKGPIVPGKTG